MRSISGVRRLSGFEESEPAEIFRTYRMSILACGTEMTYTKKEIEVLKAFGDYEGRRQEAEPHADSRQGGRTARRCRRRDAQLVLHDPRFRPADLRSASRNDPGPEQITPDRTTEKYCRIGMETGFRPTGRYGNIPLQRQSIVKTAT